MDPQNDKTQQIQPSYSYSTQQQPPPPPNQGPYNPHGRQGGPVVMMPQPQPMMTGQMVPVYGEALLPGQRGLNPCSCCKSCWGGICTLRAGCIVIAVFCILSAFGSFTNAAQPPIYPGHRPFERDVAYIIAYVRTADWFVPMNLVDSLLINLASGVIFLVGTLLPSQLCCLGFAFLQLISGFWVFILAGYISKRVDSYPKSLLEDKKTDARMAIQSILWVVVFIALAIRFYFGLCGIGLAQQLQRGEYGQSGVRSGGFNAAIIPLGQHPQMIYYPPEDIGSAQDSGPPSATHV